MKIISGKVVSSKPISVSKAEKVITGFVDTDNGASDALCEYVRRTAVAFQKLVNFHKELKNPTSHRKENASQPVKAETLADTGEILEEVVKKVQKPKKNRGLVESQSQLVTVNIDGEMDQNGLNNEVAEIPEKKKVQKRKKNHVLEANQSQLVGKKDQNVLNKEVAEIPEEQKIQKRNKNHGLDANQSQLVGKRDQNGLNNEVAEVIDQGGLESSGKKGKNKDKKERKQNEERLNIAQSSDVKGEKIEYEDAIKEFDGSVVRTGKKKRKRDEDEVGERSLEVDVKTEIAEVMDQGANESSGKRGKKKDKKERKQNEEVLNIVQSSDVKVEKIEYEDAKKEFDGSVVKTGKKKGKGKRDEDDIGEKSIEGKKDQNGLNNEVAEIPEDKKVQKHKKYHGLEANQCQSVGKKDQNGLNNEVAGVIDQGANESSGKKGKKKDKKERKQNEEQSSDVKGEKIEYDNARKEFDGSVVKTGKKKRKRDEDDVGEKSLEEDVKSENIGEASNDGKQDGKKKRKKMKAERID